MPHSSCGGTHYSRVKWRCEQAECNLVLELPELLGNGYACHVGLGQFVAGKEGWRERRKGAARDHAAKCRRSMSPMGPPVGDCGTGEADQRTDHENNFHEGHGRPPSSQKAQMNRARPQSAPQKSKRSEACPVTHGLTTVITKTPYAMSYRNLAAFSRCRSFIRSVTIAQSQRKC